MRLIKNDEFTCDFNFDDNIIISSKSDRILTTNNDELKPIILSHPKIGSKFTLKTKPKSFQDLNLSRPLLKAINILNYTNPTPIQFTTIPHILKGRDVCACASTGTGKTAAYMLPILERLIFKPTNNFVTRVLVLVPTRELGIQVYNVSKQLAQFIRYSQSHDTSTNQNVSIALCVGGLDVKQQELNIRHKPDIIIATPGRLIDLLENTPSFNLQNVEILVLDEADRMLDEFFAKQMLHILKSCALKHQILLFSATMTDKVKDLANISLKNPVKIFVDSNLNVAQNLTQEFVRIRDQRESDREAILAALLSQSFQYGVIVFVQTKLLTHRLMVILNILGLNAGELHGNLKQNERMESLKKFKEGQYNALICTDLAARGLDIEGVETVINFTLPNSYKHYVHRVGRTARAGHSGRAISLVGDQERNVFREILKNTSHYLEPPPRPLKSNSIQAKKSNKKKCCPDNNNTNNDESRHKIFYRKIDPLIITDYKMKLGQLEKEVEAKLKDEKMDRDINVAQLRVYKAEKLIKHHREIMSRPKRKWFQTHGERVREQKSLRLDPPNDLPGKASRKKRVKNSDIDESDQDIDDGKGRSNRKKKFQKKKAYKELNTEERVKREILKAKQYALKCIELSSQHLTTKTFKTQKGSLDLLPYPSPNVKKAIPKSFTKQLTDTDHKKKYIHAVDREHLKFKKPVK